MQAVIPITIGKMLNHFILLIVCFFFIYGPKMEPEVVVVVYVEGEVVTTSVG